MKKEWAFTVILSHLFQVTVMEIHREIWNNDSFSDRSCLWVHLMVISAEFTQHHGCSKWNWRQVRKSQNLYEEVFHKTWYMRKIRYERGGEILPWICVQPSVAPGRKHHQIRAYNLLIKVIAVTHQQIRVAFCQIDNITAVRHLVRGFP